MTKVDLLVRRDDSISCDYCEAQDLKVVNLRDRDIDVCFSCILQIYNLAKQETLYG